MAKKDTDLFDRLRQAGLRKQVAKALSELGDGPGKKAGEAARRAIAELRSVADEIERRLRGGVAPTSSTRKPAARKPAARKPAARKPAPTNTERAPRGANKAKILASLKSGPKTASEIAPESGIGTRTVSSTLSKMLTAGEVAKADRGYRLPG
jgi:predicted Rossmann fold nucleotide-binding protein DprA/Smf involved in DNA uptake